MCQNDEGKIRFYFFLVTHSLNKVFGHLSLLTVIGAQDWTCEECAQVGAAVGAFVTSEEAIADQVEILLTVICPQAEDEDACVESMPAFWSSISSVLMPAHFLKICHDIICAKSPSSKVILFKVYNS